MSLTGSELKKKKDLNFGFEENEENLENGGLEGKISWNKKVLWLELLNLERKEQRGFM